MASFTAEEILQALDAATKSNEFPMLDNGYVYPVDVRLSAYADEKRWVILIESMGVMPRAADFDNSVFAFGNCVEQGMVQSFTPVDASDIWDEEPDDDEWVEEDPEDERWQCDLPVRTDVKELSIRGRMARVPDVHQYETHDIQLEHAPHVQFHELMRFLAEDYRALLVATGRNCDSACQLTYRCSCGSTSGGTPTRVVENCRAKASHFAPSRKH